MMALVVAVLMASLLGSAHCVGMCGAFMAVAITGGKATDGSSRAKLQVAYHLGRLVTYLVLGTLAGAIGSAVDIAGSAAGLQRSAAMLAGAMMVIFGAIALLRHAGVRLPKAPVPAFMRDALIASHRRIGSWGPIARAAAMGLLTTLLPCGWLYAFLITAAGTARPELAAVTMLVFWLGTLPAMAIIGTGVQHLTGAMRRYLPVATSIIVIGVGLLTLLGRVNSGFRTFGLNNEPDRDMHAQIERVKNLEANNLECCKPQ